MPAGCVVTTPFSLPFGKREGARQDVKPGFVQNLMSFDSVLSFTDHVPAVGVRARLWPKNAEDAP